MKTFCINNPATREKITELPEQGVAELDAAVERATEAQRAWAGCTAYEREKVIRTATA